jgi:hypothetical protein
MDALAEIAAGIAVAQLDRLARTGRRTGGHRGPAHDAALQQHIGFNGGIATGIENLACNDINDGTHDFLPLELSNTSDDQHFKYSRER